jgi:hypothetical protein
MSKIVVEAHGCKIVTQQLRADPKIIFLYMIMQQDNCTNPR